MAPSVSVIKLFSLAELQPSNGQLREEFAHSQQEGRIAEPLQPLLPSVSLLNLLVASAVPVIAQGAKPAKLIVLLTVAEEGLKLHSLTAGQGPAVVLLHGYTQTSRMCRPIIPLLAPKFTVIVPDPLGIGDSEIPANRLDMKTGPFAFTHG